MQKALGVENAHKHAHSDWLCRAWGTFGVALFIVLLFAGFVLGARARDPFTRVWRSVGSGGPLPCEFVAVLPKAAPGPYPVVVYLHGSGGTLLTCGNDLRQMAEMGVAVVGLEYCMTNDAACDAQMGALLGWLQQQEWADTNAMAWVGFSLGAEKATRFWLRHPDARPGLLVRLAGGAVANEACAPSSKTPAPRVLLLHSDQDATFPLAEARQMQAFFQSNGVPVEFKLLAGLQHGLGPNHPVVFREIGAHCLTALRGADALDGYRSIGRWQASRPGLWVFWMPALGWGILWGIWNLARRNRRAEREQAGKAGLHRTSRVLWCGAGAMATIAAGVTAIHLGAGWLGVSGPGLAVARGFLVQPEERQDFEYLAALPCWRGQRLGALIEHAHLAHYNRGLVHWKVEDSIYREFVLSPVIGGGEGEDLRWRRQLWESLYPRVRNEDSAESAAEAVVRYLRERVTISSGAGLPRTVTEIWQRQITDEAGFERLTVAALRAAGIPREI